LGDVREATSIRFGAACLKRVDPELWTPLLAGRWLEDFDFRANLSQIRCAVLLLQGSLEQGGMVRDEDAALIERLLADCTYVHLPQAGHLIHNLLPELTLRIVSEFLDSLVIDPAAFPPSSA
jgi:pimeloyl-ACP methyl ester carboxylesterase